MPKKTNQKKVAKRGWSRELVISELQNRHKQGKALYCSKAKEEDNRLFKAILRYFENYDDALVAAGLNPKDFRLNRKWSRESIVSELQNRHKQGKALCSSKVKEEDNNLFKAILRYFENYGDALVAAGLNPEDFRLNRKWSRESIVSELQSRYKQGKALCSSKVGKEDKNLHQVIFQYFENYDDALVAAGLNPEDFRLNRKWSRESIVSELQNRHKQGKTLCISKVKEEDNRLFKAISYYFENYGDALVAAGLNPEDFRLNRKWSRESIVSELQNRHKQGKALYRSKVEKEDRKLYQVIFHYFENYDDALVVAGFNPRDHCLVEWRKFILNIVNENKPVTPNNSSNNHDFFTNNQKLIEKIAKHFYRKRRFYLIRKGFQLADIISECFLVLFDLASEDYGDKDFRDYIVQELYPRLGKIFFPLGLQKWLTKNFADRLDFNEWLIEEEAVEEMDFIK